MKFRHAILVIVAGVLCGAPAQAFQQSNASKPAPGSEAKIAPDARTLDLSADKMKRESGTGTAISIPGLGTLGVLPKLDFGLELLYGDQPTTAVKPREDDQETEGLRIKGTLKHRF